MAFTTKKIKSKTVGIIDIWTYKIRVAITKYKNKDLELIGYWEKRSFITEYNSVSDALDTKQTYEHISDAIKKAETDAQTKITEVIINIPFQELFFEFSKVNYIFSSGNLKNDQSSTILIHNEKTQIVLSQHMVLREVDYIVQHMISTYSN